MSQSKFDQLLQKYLAGQCTPEEEKIVLEWYEQLINNSELHLSEEERTVIESRLWEGIQVRTQDTPRETGSSPAPIRTLKRRNAWKWAAAACILSLVLAGIFLFRRPFTSIQYTNNTPSKEGFKSWHNETGMEKKIMLSDSTQIMLQPGASVEYPDPFKGNTREVFLSGNAFFNVHHNPAKHFKVHLGGILTTEVLGTSFNIIQNNATASIEVAVVTGKVHVFQQDQPTTNDQPSTGVILTRNRKVIFNTTTSQFTTGLVENPQPFIRSSQPALSGNDDQQRPLIFEDEPLHAVLEILSRAYGISITTESEKLGLYHFTGNISKYDLYKQLDIICQSTQSVYEIKEDQIIIKERP